MRKLKLSEWVVPPIYHLLRKEDIGALKITWPVYQDDARVDQLTDIPNRRAFDEALLAAIKEANAQAAYFSLLIFDVDFFKKVNDTHGHAVGDAVLKEFSARISGALRNSDICFRYGGEEFCLLTMASSDNSLIIGERVRLAVKQKPIIVPGHEPIGITCSYGCSTYPFDALSGVDLFSKADEALYRAKESGRDRGLKYETR